MTEPIDRTVDGLERVINKILFLKKRRLFEFRGVAFFPSEVHLMLAVTEKSAKNATRIAEKLGVTKGAVSQTLARLEKKGVLTKTRDTTQKNEITLDFTPFGLAAYEHYQSRTAGIRKRHEDLLRKFTVMERTVIRRFLAGLERGLDEIR